ncbi:hypothetical protein PR048_000319 [Dryococelus australis]|uniref:Uncharacterized protein n=1 Tax=Dryococelus australis TaxID=614101 RepID=A0ABQ9IEB5_9NEOP|nr:hypothetical protein PR048_000319 [Dryococelus australis]
MQGSVATADSAQSLRGLLSAIIENVAALKVLNLPVDQWDMLLLHLLEKHRDHALRKQWELVVHELDIPTLSEFTDFLEKHCTSIKSLPKSVAFVRVIIQSTDALNVCKTTLRQIFKWQRTQLCINCLQATHQVKSCPSTKSCRFCNGRHNTMLHFPLAKPTTTLAQSAQDEVTVDTPSNKVTTLSVLFSFSKDSQPSAVMLTTPVAMFRRFVETASLVRVLLNCVCKPISLLNHACLDKVSNINYYKFIFMEFPTPCLPALKVFCREPLLAIEALVLPLITSHVPSTFFKTDAWEHIYFLSF